MMTTKSTIKMQDYLARRRKKTGERQRTFLLDEEAIEFLHMLCRETGESQGKVIKKALIAEALRLLRGELNDVRP
jgi:hypothetical protein